MFFITFLSPFYDSTTPLSTKTRKEITIIDNDISYMVASRGQYYVIKMPHSVPFFNPQKQKKAVLPIGGTATDIR